MDINNITIFFTVEAFIKKCSRYVTSIAFCKLKPVENIINTDAIEYCISIFKIV